MKLLAVDDSAMIRRIISDSAEVMGLDVIEAEDGIEAMKILAKSGADISLVLLDWHMPHMSGLDVLKKIKADDKLSKIPVMMVTTESERESILTAIREGADNYLCKPFAVEDLITKIRNSIDQIE